jgi:hypothetical protein
MIAEEAPRELYSAGDPGGYLITVSLEDKTSIVTQVVVIPPKHFGAAPSEGHSGKKELN